MSKNNKIEAPLWKTADKLRNNMVDATEYKHMIPGLIFLKNISDSFEDLYNKLNDEDIAAIGEVYHNWRSKEWENKYKDVPGLLKEVTSSGDWEPWIVFMLEGVKQTTIESLMHWKRNILCMNRNSCTRTVHTHTLLFAQIPE